MLVGCGAKVLVSVAREALNTRMMKTRWSAVGHGQICGRIAGAGCSMSRSVSRKPVRACGRERPGQVSCLRHPGTNPGAAACDADMRSGIGNRLACRSLNPRPLIPIRQTKCRMRGDDECRDLIRAAHLPLHHWPALACRCTFGNTIFPFLQCCKAAGCRAGIVHLNFTPCPMAPPHGKRLAIAKPPGMKPGG